jgi:hypothetical protein
LRGRQCFLSKVPADLPALPAPVYRAEDGGHQSSTQLLKDEPGIEVRIRRMA